MRRPGYPDYHPRVPPGWRVVKGVDWPINTSYGPGQGLDLEAWRLETYGAVERPLSLRYGELLGLPMVKKILDHHCVDGWSYIGHEWEGVEFSTIKEMTRPLGDARFILIECEGGVSQSFPITQDLLFAVRRNGNPLTRAGGFPLRVVAPGEFGYKSAKWVRRVKFTVEREPDFWDKKMDEWGLPRGDPSINPWNCSNEERKASLRKIFASILEERRRERAARAAGRMDR